jgi:hypothetical protein
MSGLLKPSVIKAEPGWAARPDPCLWLQQAPSRETGRSDGATAPPSGQPLPAETPAIFQYREEEPDPVYTNPWKNMACNDMFNNNFYKSHSGDCDKLGLWNLR